MCFAQGDPFAGTKIPFKAQFKLKCVYLPVQHEVIKIVIHPSPNHHFKTNCLGTFNFYPATVWLF